MSDDRVRRRAAVKPLKWIGKGVSRGARGVWRVVRRRRRDRALPLASLTATLVDSRLAASSDISSEWSGGEGGDDLIPFQLPQLQLPSWLTAAVDSWTLNLSSSSSSRVYPNSSSNSRSSLGGISAQPVQIQIAAAAAADRPYSSSNSSQAAAVHDASSVQVLAQMLNTDNTFPMVLQPISSSSSASSSSGKWRSPQPDHSPSKPGPSQHTPQQQQQQQVDDDLPLVSSSSSGQQQLLTVGTRHWGNWWDGRGLLKVKIYDFAVYVDGQQAGDYLPANANSAAVGGQQRQQQQQQLDLPAQIKSHSSGVGMSLVLKAAREVPLHMLQEEYAKVLTRRLAVAGGDSSDSAALKQLLSGLGDPQRLPAVVRRGPDASSVAKGAMIVFERSADGQVTARIGPHVLDTVRSPKLSEALFDLYLGDQPVSRAAKDAAAETLHRITQQQHVPYYVPRGGKEQIKCEGLAGSGRKSAAKQDLGLTVSDLAACVLLMGQ